ncbi:hypothetical protein [Aldersonia kunmingensis]|uniref:hypothetical protein n=1 Tax=Aldersonia kunmingensis TaxID=408066 RepID=UPI0016511CFD|nr:hypothetical protein [Aldersonia kunmingensis]
MSRTSLRAVENCFVPDRHTMETFSTTPARPEPVYQLGLLGMASAAMRRSR